MTITLYDFTAAPSPLRTRIFLHEKGIPFESVQVDLGSGEQLSEAYRKINPSCTVPAIVLDDGSVLNQNTAIALYLEGTHPEPPLFGKGPADAAKVMNASAQVETGGLMAVAEVLRNSSPRMKDRALTGPENYGQIPELAERGRARLAHFIDSINESLAGREFLAIDTFSFADITAFVAVDFAKWVKVTPNESHTHLKRWFEAVSARPSIAAAKTG